MSSDPADGALPDGFDWLSLDPEEEVVWTGKPHSMSLVPALVIGIPLSLVLVGLPIVASAYLARENTEYVITTEALYKKRGVLSRDVKRVGFEKVQDTSYTQGFFGTQFGFGDVDISTAGGSGVELSLDSVGDPKRIQELINERIRARDGRGGRGGDADAETKPDVLADILAELRAIRTAVEDTDGAADGSAGSDDGGADMVDTESPFVAEDDGDR
ncbi:PH domain-containing protein [Halobaculum litoreum]|uniref:PH domain-containing protein n=1 Tax=Halobaculum litoreum TaxID=3031998 RepID=A0ABD5XUK6_9EURY|nr:PH domain-containing protein [Halobaculum sp. DT92]